MNYKHDGIYVALARERAAIHTAFNKYGSELLERCILLYNLLSRSNIRFEIPESINLFRIEKYINCEPRPIVIKIHEIDEEKLEKEDGGIAKDALSFLRSQIPQMTEKQKFEFLQFCNFKILEPIKPSLLTFYDLDFEGHPRDNNFEFTLSKIY